MVKKLMRTPIFRRTQKNTQKPRLGDTIDERGLSISCVLSALSNSEKVIFYTQQDEFNLKIFFLLVIEHISITLTKSL